MDVSLSVGHHPHRDLLLDNVDPVVLHRHLMHVPYHTVPISGLFWSKLSISVSRHDNESQMLPPASALRPNPSLLASLFVGSGLCSLCLVGKDSARGSSALSVASSFFRRIQSFHTWNERSKLIKLSRCLLSADSSLSPCHSTSSKYYCINCRWFYDSPCTTGSNIWTLSSPSDVAHILKAIFTSLIAGCIATNAFSL